MTTREFENYVGLMKVLSEAGFQWSKAGQCWKRRPDDAVVSDEAIIDFVQSFPALVLRASALFQKGAKGVKISTIDDKGDECCMRLEAL